MKQANPFKSAKHHVLSPLAQGKRHCANAKGVTLVELVVSMAILSMVVIATVALLNLPQSTYRDQITKNQAKMLAQNVETFILEEIKFAKALTIGDGNTTSEGAHILYVDSDGRLSYDGQAVFDESLYRQFQLKLQFNQETETTVGLEITVEKQETLIYQAKSAVNLLNVPLNAAPANIIGGNASGSSVAFIK